MNINIKKWPFWLKGGGAAAIIGTVLFLCLPENFSNLAYTPWWAGWFILPAFFIFSMVCIIFRVDFVSNTDSVIHLALLNILWIASIFLTFFAIGAIIGLVAGRLKSKKT